MTFDEWWEETRVLIPSPYGPDKHVVFKNDAKKLISAFAAELQKRIEANGGCGMEDENGNLPCPFCGTYPTQLGQDDLYPGETPTFPIFCRCENEDCAIARVDILVSKNAWNTRPPLSCGSVRTDGTAPSCPVIIDKTLKEWLYENPASWQSGIPR